MIPVMNFLAHRPGMFAIIVCAVVAVPVWYLTGDYSPWQ